MVRNFVITLAARPSEEALYGRDGLTVAEKPVVPLVARRIVNYTWRLRAKGSIHLLHPQLCWLQDVRIGRNIAFDGHDLLLSASQSS
jgi:hypothetical protein